jgi:hypothetical protein
MWQVKLDESGHLCLYLNAWKTDFVEDPLVAVVGELSIAIKRNSLLDKAGLFHSKERFEQLKTLSRPALSLRHIIKVMVTI